MIFKLLVGLTVALSLVSATSVYAEASLYDILDYDVGYDIENAEILVMTLDVDFTSLTIDIVSFDDGFIELNIPRGLVDALLMVLMISFLYLSMVLNLITLKLIQMYLLEH